MSLSKLNYVNVGRDGTFAPSGDVNSTPADVDALMGHLRSEAKNHVVIHLHGGLVSESAGMGVAESMLPTYEAAGAHPVSIVYETGFLETLQGNLSSIHETKLFAKLIKYVRKFTARKLGLDALEGIADAEPDLTRPASELESDPWFTALEGAPLEAPEAVGESEEAAQAEIERWLESDEEMPAIIREEARMDIVQAESIADKDEAIFTWAATARTILQIGTRVTARYPTGPGLSRFHCPALRHIALWSRN